MTMDPLAAVALAALRFTSPPQNAPAKGTRLDAALKEHGPHLRLRNDLTLAEYFAGRVETATVQ